MGTAAEKARELAAVADRLRDLRPIMEVVAADVRTFIDDRFATATDVAGRAFAPLSATTEAISPRRIGGTPLSDTTRLRRSITAAANSRGLRLGTNVIYAGAQNFGNAVNRVFGGVVGPIPARRFLPVSTDGLRLEPDSFWAEQRQAIARWIRTGEIA